MTLDVRWFSTLVKRTRSQLPRTTVVWEHGVSPRTIFKDEGFDDVDADHVIAVVNGAQVSMDTPLKDGDGVEFLVGISGGCGGSAVAPRHSTSASDYASMTAGSDSRG